MALTLKIVCSKHDNGEVDSDSPSPSLIQDAVGHYTIEADGAETYCKNAPEIKDEEDPKEEDECTFEVSVVSL